MTLHLPPELPEGELLAWLAQLRHATSLALTFGEPGEDGTPVEANGEVLGTLAPEAGAEERVEACARLLSRLAEGHIARRDLVATTARLWKEQNFLTGVATSLQVSDTREQTAQRLLARIVKLLGVGRASILLAREDGRLAVTAAHGLNQASHVGSVIPEGGVADRVFRSGEPLLVEDVDRLASDDQLARSLHHEARSNSFLSVPIPSNGVPIGVINLTDRAASRPFQAEDRKLVSAIAAQVGIAFANVTLLEEARRTEGLKRELDLAARIQRTLLPKGPFAVPGFDVFGRCEPAAYVGGDSFEVAARHGGGLWAAVADVSGHGISAALLMASARAALKALVAADLTPAEAAASLNALVTADVGDTGMFLTAALLRVDGNGAARLVSMGHPEAFVRRAGGTLERLGAGGAPAGIVDDETYPEDRFTLGPGDAVLLFTDGLSEANDGAADFGEDGIARVLHAAGGDGAAAVTEALYAAVYDHVKGRSVNDDITVLLSCRT